MQIGNWQLVHETTGKPVNVGDIITSFRGIEYLCTGGMPPHHSGSTGRIMADDGEFFPGVFGCKWSQINQ